MGTLTCTQSQAAQKVPEDSGDGADGVDARMLHVNVWAAGPGKMNSAVYAAAAQLPPCAQVRVLPMAYEL